MCVVHICNCQHQTPMSKHVGDMQRMFLYINASCKCCKAVMNEVFGVFFMSNLENNTVH